MGGKKDDLTHEGVTDLAMMELEKKMSGGDSVGVLVLLLYLRLERCLES